MRGRVKKKGKLDNGGCELWTKSRPAWGQTQSRLHIYNDILCSYNRPKCASVIETERGKKKAFCMPDCEMSEPDRMHTKTSLESL